MQPLKKEKDIIRFFREQVCEIIYKNYETVKDFCEDHELNQNVISSCDM